MFFLILFNNSFFNARASDAMPLHPRSRISILQQKTKLAFNKSYFNLAKFYQFKYDRKAQTSCLLLKN